MWEGLTNGIQTPFFRYEKTLLKVSPYVSRALCSNVASSSIRRTRSNFEMAVYDSGFPLQEKKSAQNASGVL